VHKISQFQSSIKNQSRNPWDLSKIRHAESRTTVSMTEFTLISVPHECEGKRESSKKELVFFNEAPLTFKWLSAAKQCGNFPLSPRVLLLSAESSWQSFLLRRPFVRAPVLEIRAERRNRKARLNKLRIRLILGEQCAPRESYFADCAIIIALILLRDEIFSKRCSVRHDN